MPDASTRLVLGLGNPGAEYEGTRHNVGYEVLDRVAARLGASFFPKGRALRAGGERGGAAYLLAKPTTFMNNSGRAARDLVAEFSEPVELLVVCDDFHLPLGRLRCRRSGSSGGQKGLASILEHLEDRDVPRLRLGLGDPPGRQPVDEFVLGRFRRGEEAEAAEMVDRAAQAVEDWLEHGDFERMLRRVNTQLD